MTLQVKDAVCDRFRAVAGTARRSTQQRPDVRIHAFLAERRS